jgi:ribosome-binding protein aMBF1 (putative translation factor)
MDDPSRFSPILVTRRNNMRFSHTRQGLRITLPVKKNLPHEQRKKLLVLLRNIRIDAGLTQAELASRLSRDQTFVSKYESGERRLDVLELREVCLAIGIDFTEFTKQLERELNQTLKGTARNVRIT